MLPRNLVLAALLGLALPATAAEEASRQPSLPAITVVKVSREHLVDRVFASGLIEPVERVYVQPQIEGQAIDALLADVGDRVEAGQVLARLSETALTLQRSQLEASRASADAGIAQAEAQRIEAEAVRDEAVRTRDRAVSLAARGAGSQAAADEATSQAATALARVTVAVQALSAAEAQARVVDAQLADLDLQLRRTQVTAPVAGEIVAREARVGGIASASAQPMFELIRDGRLELRADVPEKDVTRVQVGQKVRITAVGLPAPIAGTVRLVEPTVNETTRLGRARITIDEAGKVRSGMFASAEIIVADRDGLALPISAVTETPGAATVLAVRDGVVKQMTIETGIRDGARVEVAKGLSEGETVVARAGAFVRDGDRINPVPAEPDAPAVN